ncbi:MAG: hypothetical protein WBY66_24050, partial [Candidatus Acidiferrales bacterium]
IERWEHGELLSVRFVLTKTTGRPSANIGGQIPRTTNAYRRNCGALPGRHAAPLPTLRSTISGAPLPGVFF